MQFLNNQDLLTKCSLALLPFFVSFDLSFFLFMSALKREKCLRVVIFF